jgi:hypothetical protein
VSDLDAAIRAKLAVDQDSYYFEYDCEMIQGAMFAALDQHQPVEGDEPGDIMCSCNPRPDDPYVAYAYPCPTVKAIATALGIEVDGG